VRHIREHVGILRHSYEAVERAHPGCDEKYIFHDALQAMQKTLTLDLIHTTAANVARSGALSLAEVRALPDRMAVFSQDAQAQRMEEKRYLYDALYTCPALELEHSKAEEVVTELFQFWSEEPDELPDAYIADIESEGIARVVADYIAGMTDNFILLQYAEVRRRVRAGRLPMRSIAR
jgi:dGTPase